MKKLWKKTKKFITDVVKAAYTKVKNFFKACYQHTEAAILLTLSAIGLNALLAELPFYVMLPMWIEATMVIPIASVLVVAIMLQSAEWRANRRNARSFAYAA